MSKRVCNRKGRLGRRRKRVLGRSAPFWWRLRMRRQRDLRRRARRMVTKPDPKPSFDVSFMAS